MRARDLAAPAPLVRLATPAQEALRILGDSGLPGLVLQDGQSFVVVPASQVLKVALPRFVLDDAALGRVWDEPSADALTDRLAGRTAADLLAALDGPVDEPPHTVDSDANVVEIAAVMAAAHVPLVAVVDRGEFRGVVTVNRLLGCLLA